MTRGQTIGWVAAICATCLAATGFWAQGRGDTLPAAYRRDRLPAHLTCLQGKQGTDDKARTSGKPASGKKAQKPEAPPVPVSRDAAVTAVTRRVLTQLLKGKVDPALLTPAMRAKLTPGKAKSMGASLRGFGPLKAVSLVSRKAGEPAEVCTLRVVLGDTTFIATVGVTTDNRVNDLLLLEE